MSVRSLTLLGLAWTLAACSEPAPVDSMEVVEVVRDLLAETDGREVTRAHPEFEPRVDVITPARHYSLDGADMPALEMPPPCEITFGLAAGDAPSVLRARAGVDVSILRHFSEKQPSATFEFEVLLDDASVFRERITLRRDSVPAGTEWRDVGGEVPGGTDREAFDSVHELAPESFR